MAKELAYQTLGGEKEDTWAWVIKHGRLAEYLSKANDVLTIVQPLLEQAFQDGQKSIIAHAYPNRRRKK